jgi:hypothetical protein
VLGENHQDVAGTLENMTIIYDIQGKHDEAIQKNEEALMVYTQALGNDNPHSARVHYSIALSKFKVSDSIGGMESALASVRMHTDLGISDGTSQRASDLLRVNLRLFGER